MRILLVESCFHTIESGFDRIESLSHSVSGEPNIRSKSSIFPGRLFTIPQLPCPASGLRFLDEWYLTALFTDLSCVVIGCRLELRKELNHGDVAAEQGDWHGLASMIDRHTARSCMNSNRSGLEIDDPELRRARAGQSSHRFIIEFLLGI